MTITDVKHNQLGATNDSAESGGTTVLFLFTTIDQKILVCCVYV